MSVAEFIEALQRETRDEAFKALPVERWNPPFCGDAGIEIRADGSWWHEGARMERERLVKLFASILRKDDDGETYLVTPGERQRIQVADAPFLAVRADRRGEVRDQVVAFTTNLDEVVAAGPARPIRVACAEDGEPRPYVLVRGRLEARILRAPFYELADWAVEEPSDEGPRLGLWSQGAFFPLGTAGSHL